MRDHVSKVLKIVELCETKEDKTSFYQLQSMIFTSYLHQQVHPLHQLISPEIDQSVVVVIFTDL